MKAENADRNKGETKPDSRFRLNVEIFPSINMSSTLEDFVS
jgi:hypothetical protein